MSSSPRYEPLWISISSTGIRPGLDSRCLVGMYVLWFSPDCSSPLRSTSRATTTSAGPVVMHLQQRLAPGFTEIRHLPAAVFDTGVMAPRAIDLAVGLAFWAAVGLQLLHHILISSERPQSARHRRFHHHKVFHPGQPPGGVRHAGSSRVPSAITWPVAHSLGIPARCSQRALQLPTSLQPASSGSTLPVRSPPQHVGNVGARQRPPVPAAEIPGRRFCSRDARQQLHLRCWAPISASMALAWNRKMPLFR